MSAHESILFTNFLYPVIILIIGSGITYFLGTKLPEKNREKQKLRDIEKEDYKHGLEIKKDLVRRISRITTEQMLLLESRAIDMKQTSNIQRKKKDGIVENKVKYDITYKWMVNGREILHLLNLYFQNKDLTNLWLVIYPVLRDVSQIIDDPEGCSSWEDSINRSLKTLKHGHYDKFSMKSDPVLTNLLFGCINEQIFRVLGMIQNTPIQYQINNDENHNQFY